MKFAGTCIAGDALHHALGSAPIQGLNLMMHLIRRRHKATRDDLNLNVLGAPAE